MAKKVVATLKKEKGDSEKIVKIIKTERSQKSGAYTFREELVTADKVSDYFKS